MPTSVLADDDEQIIADLQRDVRRLRSRLATTAPRGGHDAWTAAATPATTYQLSVIPILGTCLMALNGHVQREGTDYTCDYTTGIVTVSATQASGDKVVFRYLITDWLVARTVTPDIGSFSDNFNRADYVLPPTRISGADSIAAPTGLGVGDLMLLVICTGAGGVFSSGPTGGWTLLSELTNATGGGFDCRARLYYRTATSGDIGATYTWSTTAGSRHAAITAYVGATGISGSTTGTTGTANSYTAPATTTAGNELMVTVFAAATDSSSASTTAFTTDAAIDEALATSFFFHCGITDNVNLGRTTAVTATMTSGYHPSWVSWTLAIAGVRRTVPSLGAPWVPVTRAPTDPKSLGSVFGIISNRAQSIHDDGSFASGTFTPEVYVNVGATDGALDYDFINHWLNDGVFVRYDPTAVASGVFPGYYVTASVVVRPNGSTMTNTLTGGLAYVNGSWSGLTGHAQIVISGTSIDVYRNGVHEFNGVMNSNLDKTCIGIQATSGQTFWDNFAWVGA